jgi:hypothetical protein
MTTAVAKQQPVLAVFVIVRCSLQALWRERRAVARIGAPPFAVALGIHLLYSLLKPGSSNDPGTDIAVGVALSLPYVFFSVAMFRYLLGHPNIGTGWELAHSAALAWAAAKCVLLTVLGFLFHDTRVSAVLFIGIAYGLARFSFFVPAVAVGEYPDLALAWSRTRRNGWRLVAIRGLVWTLVLLPTAALGWAMTAAGLEPSSALPHVFVVATALVEAIGCSTVAHAFYYARPEAA